MRIKRDRMRTLILLTFMFALAVFPPLASAQYDGPDYKNYDIGGGGSGGGGGSCDFCSQPQCGCDSGSMGIGVVLIQWVCICDTQEHGICMQTCWYATY